MRYATKVSLIVKLDSNNVEMIYPPYLDITYEEKAVSEIEKSVGNSKKELTFSTAYEMDTTGFWSGVRKLNIVSWIVLAGLILINFCINQKADRLDTDENARIGDSFFSGLFDILHLFSSIFFWMMVLVTGCAFVFFKFQERVYFLVPPLTPESIELNYKYYDRFLIALTITRFFSLLFKIYE